MPEDAPVNPITDNAIPAPPVAVQIANEVKARVKEAQGNGVVQEMAI